MGENNISSANQLWKESQSSLSFKDWLIREKEKGMFIPNKAVLNEVGGDILADETKESSQTVSVNNKKNFNRINNVLMLSVLVAVGFLAYKKYSTK